MVGAHPMPRCASDIGPAPAEACGSMCQPACKPGSVGRGGASPPRVTAIPLGRPSPAASSNQPGRQPGDGLGHRWPRRPYSILLPVGLAMRPTLPPARCALTAPFHPCPAPFGPGGLLSVALSLGSPPPDVVRHRVSVEPGLSSALARDGRPAGWHSGLSGTAPDGNAGAASAHTRTGCSTRPAEPNTRR